LGHAPQTLAYYRKVLEYAPHDLETLQELAEQHLERARFDEAVGTLRALVEAAPHEERAPILERIADVLHGQLKNPGRAISTCLEALELDGANRRILQKLLDLQSEMGQWKAALDTIGRFVELETDTRRRGKYIQAMAAIRRFKLKDDGGALDEYEQALAAFLD